MARIGLGTVQMGLNYGVSNDSGQISAREVGDILLKAQEMGVEILDTAFEYGNSEVTLGRNFPEDHGFRVVTKTPRFGGVNENPAESLRKAFVQSICNLSLNNIGNYCLYGLMMHSMDDVRGEHGEKYIEAMISLREAGNVKKIGVSIYDANDIDFILSKFTPDIIQLPINIADQRLLRSGHIQKLKDLGVEIHARSLFLQGLLLMDAHKLPTHLTPLEGYLANFERVVHNTGLTKLEACLSFGLNIPEIDHLIIGVTSLSQLSQLETAIPVAAPTIMNFESLAMLNETYLNPANWKNVR